MEDKGGEKERRERGRGREREEKEGRRGKGKKKKRDRSKGTGEEGRRWRWKKGWERRDKGRGEGKEREGGKEERKRETSKNKRLCVGVQSWQREHGTKLQGPLFCSNNQRLHSLSRKAWGLNIVFLICTSLKKPSGFCELSYWTLVSGLLNGCNGNKCVRVPVGKMPWCKELCEKLHVKCKTLGLDRQLSQ